MQGYELPTPLPLPLHILNQKKHMGIPLTPVVPYGELIRKHGGKGRETSWNHNMEHY